MTEVQLRSAIRLWIDEYGQGGLPHEKTTNFLQSLIDHKGFVPNSSYRGITLGTRADEVEQAVCVMAATPAEPGDKNILFRSACVMRVYYLWPKYWPEDERVDYLREIGLPMSKSTYYRSVQLARAFIMGFLP